VTKQKPERTPHLDPLSLRARGEEKAARGLLSPAGGEDQGEGASARVIRRARALRKKLTWAEKILWRHLRNRKEAGWKFRRQHPVGFYDLDFYCAEARLAVELDGREHGHPERQRSDHKRKEYLAQLGIKVIRFWNYSVRENLRSVLDTILRELRERTPHLDPLPFKRGEENPPRAVAASGNQWCSGAFLSPTGGQDQGEGATTSQQRPHKKHIGPKKKLFGE
jgi:very-short-patch-repair endonuclease